MNHSPEIQRFGKFETIDPDQPFDASYESNGQVHFVVIQWMGEGKGVTPAYYVFEGKEYTEKPEYPAISPKEWVNLTDEQLQEIFPDEKDFHPAEATCAIDYTEGIGWTERGKGKTEHAEVIGKVIEKLFGPNKE